MGQPYPSSNEAAGICPITREVDVDAANICKPEVWWAKGQAHNARVTPLLVIFLHMAAGRQMTTMQSQTPSYRGVEEAQRK